MFYRIGQLVAPDAPTAAAYICQDLSSGALRLILGEGDDKPITLRALRRFASNRGMRIELRDGVERLDWRGARRAVRHRAARQKHG